MNISKHSKLIFYYFVFIFIWWAIYYVTGKATIDGEVTFGGALYQVAFGLIPLLGGLLGLLKSKKWGGTKSYVGRALLFISIGAICWGVGQMVWSVYYNILNNVDIPYPSLADVGYSLSFPFLALGLFNLSKATGARFSIRHPKGKLLALFIAAGVIVVAYYLLIVVGRGGVIDFTEGGLKLFFDLAYPIGDFLILLSSLLIYGLSYNYLGGRYKISILCVILGLVVLFFGDFSFSYTTTVGTYYNGTWVDMILPTAWMLIVLGVNSFDFEKD